jgi:hypothetical protein
MTPQDQKILTPIAALPDNLTVRGPLHLSDTHIITALPDNLTVRYAPIPTLAELKK